MSRFLQCTALLIMLATFLFPRFVRGQDGDAGADPTDSSDIQQLTDDELRSLLAPIALYPDALLAQVLPASAYPTQIVAAYRYTQSAATPTVPPDGTDWDASVVSLLNYPTVLKKLDDDLPWTEQLGYAATYQMQDVTDTIQQIRAEAEAAGNLASNEQQIVTTDADTICIEPASPDVIYVPEYEPDVIFVHHDHWENFIHFGTGFRFGIWLGNNFDWHHHRIGIHAGWDHVHGRWTSSARPIYWRPPHRPLPTWYRKGANRAPPVRAVPRAPLRPNISQKRPERPVPPPSRAVRPARPEAKPAPRPAVPERPRISAQPRLNEGLGNTGKQVKEAANRGAASRQPAPARPAPRPAPPPKPAPPARPAPAPRPAPRPAPPPNVMRPSSGPAARQESQRGSASRGASPPPKRR